MPIPIPYPFRLLCRLGPAERQQLIRSLAHQPAPRIPPELLAESTRLLDETMATWAKADDA